MTPLNRIPLTPPWNNPSATAEIHWPDGLSITCALIDATVIWLGAHLNPARFDDFTMVVREPSTSQASKQGSEGNAGKKES